MNTLAHRRKQTLRVVAIIALAALFRAGLVALPRVIRWDEPNYLWLGRALFTGRPYSISGVPELHYTPLLPLLSGSIYVATGNPELGSDVWMVLFGALTALPIYAIARRLFNIRVALLSALLVAFFPTQSSAVLYWGTMTEPLFVFLIFAAAWAVMMALDGDRLWAWPLAGGLLSLAYLARPEGLVWFAGFGVFLALTVLSRILNVPEALSTGGQDAAKSAQPLKTAARFGLYVATFALVAAPYAAFLWRETGSLMLTGKLSITHDIGGAVLERNPVLYDQVSASLDEHGEILWWSESRFHRGVLDIIRENPRGFAERIWGNLRQMRDNLFSSLVFPLFLLMPIILGWFRRPWTRRRLWGEALLAFSALPVLSFIPFHIEVRFFAPALPVLLIWVAVGVDAIGDWVAETLEHWRPPHGGIARRRIRQMPDAEEIDHLDRSKAVTMMIIAVLLLLFIGATHVRVIRRGLQDLAFAHKEAGLWLKENTSPEASIMSRDLAISLYAERGFVASPRAEYAQWLGYARRKGATHVVVDERELSVLRPHLAFLLDQQNPPHNLEPVFSAHDARGVTIVYRIKD
jgi:hypothetical protein